MNRLRVSIPETTPWVRILGEDAFDECDGLNSDSNALDGRYALLSNQEWMTIARDAERQGDNWTKGLKANGEGDGCMYKGIVNRIQTATQSRFCDDEHSNRVKVLHRYGTTSNFEGVQAVGLGNDNERYRQLSLSGHSNRIWDLSGNAWEWVDWDMNDEVFTLVVPGERKATRTPTPLGNWDEVVPGENVNANVGDEDPMPPSSFRPHFLNNLGGQGMGRYTKGGKPRTAATRGGGSLQGDLGTGVLTLRFRIPDLSTPDFDIGQIGFRCVYRQPLSNQED